MSSTLIVADNLLCVALYTSASYVDPMKKVALAIPSFLKVIVKKIVGEVEEDVYVEVVSGALRAGVPLRVAFTPRAPTTVTQLSVVPMVLDIKNFVRG